MTEPLRLYLVAGEPSGDLIGGRLIAALRALSPRPIELRGVGGPAMAAAGLDSLFPMDELSVMGVLEVVPRAPALFRRMRQVADAVTAFRPHALVTIDAPAFAFGVVRRLPDRSVPRIHYVAPTVWAWRPWRVHKFRKNFDHLMTLLPFEPPYFERVGLPATFVGHPILESAAGGGDGAAFRRRHGIDPAARLVCVLPGSRRGEVDRLGAVLGASLARLANAVPGLRVVVPTVPNVADRVAAMAAAWPGAPVLTHDEAEKYDAMAAADAAIAASGTVALELAMAGVPPVIVYRVSAFTGLVVRMMVRVRYANLVNLILDRMAVPELLQDRARPEAIADTVAEILRVPARAGAIRQAQREALAAIGAGDEAPSRQAARTVLRLAGLDLDGSATDLAIDG
ncbi:MAG: lipid-A-disaccharide synthase [Alphaproteobacteria bacterium]